MEPWFVKDAAFPGHLTEGEMSLFLQVCPKRPYRKREALFYMGDLASTLHILVEGQVKLTTTTSSGGERILAICGPSDFIGELFLPEVGRHRSDAVALTDVVSCPVSREQCVQLMRDVPNAVFAFTAIMASRLSQCHEQLVDAGNPVGRRVTGVLVEQARRFGLQNRADWVELATELTHDDIAAMVGATRVSVSMAFADLRGRGLLEGSRRRYLVNLPALESLADEE